VGTGTSAGVYRPPVLRSNETVTSRLALPAVILAFAASASLAGCGPSSSSSSAPTATAKAASPESSAAAAGTVPAKAACEALARWENSSSSGSVADDASLRKTFADTTPALSKAFAAWTSAIKAGSSLVNADADLVSLDCATEGVTVFPSLSDSAPPATAPAGGTASSAPAGNGPAGTLSQMQALAAAENYLGDGQGFSRQGLIDQLDSSYGNSFSVADATWAVDHSGANWDAQAVECAKGYMSSGQGFSRQGLIDQMTSAYGNKFTLPQAEYAATAVGL